MSPGSLAPTVGERLPVKLLRLPDLAALSPSARADLDRAERLFAAFGEADLSALRNRLRDPPWMEFRSGDPALCALEHRLAEDFRWSHPAPAARSGQALREINILFGAGAMVPNPSGWTARDLARQLLQWSSYAGGHGRFRDSAMLTQPDCDGASRLYPAAAAALGRLPVLLDYIQGSQPPAFRAMAAMVTMTNAHVLSDGNGRTSRLLFNWILHRGTGGRCYVPLYELTLRTRGSFILCVREAETFGDWAPLARYLAGALDLLTQETSMARRAARKH